MAEVRWRRSRKARQMDPQIPAAITSTNRNQVTFRIVISVLPWQ